MKTQTKEFSLFEGRDVTGYALPLVSDARSATFIEINALYQN